MLSKVLEGEGGRGVIGYGVGGKSMEVSMERGREVLIEVSEEVYLREREKMEVLVVVLVVMILEVQVWKGIGGEGEEKEVLKEKVVVNEEEEERVVDGMVLKEELQMMGVVLMEMRVTKMVVMEVVRYSSSE